MSALITWLGSLGAWFGAQVAAKWGFKVALIGTVLATYATMWAAILLALSLVASLMPSSGFTPFLLQFFPSQSAIAICTSAYYGSMLSRAALDYWRHTFGVASVIGSS